ncbi:MAG: phosphatase PAP2 family protein [Novosphingobium sp.]
MKKRNIALGLAAVLGLASAAVHAQQKAEIHNGAAQPTGFFNLKGYLPQGTVPDSLLLNPPPPAAGSPAEARDLEGAKNAVALRGSARWALATRDADFMSPAATAGYSCAAGIAIGPQTTPKLDMLMQRVARDLAGATRPTKVKYMRPRPFTVNQAPICTPDQEAVLRSDGSYPSGHSALGYGWGLVLAEAIPDRAAQLVARGRAFGDSRRICNVHWLSDIEEGRVVASAVVARLNAEPEFQADLAAARAEAAALADRGPGQDCAAEAALLAL